MKPPKKPAIAPTIVPMITPTSMLANPMKSEVRAPLMTSVEDVALEAAGLAEPGARAEGGRPW